MQGILLYRQCSAAICDAKRPRNALIRWTRKHRARRNERAALARSCGRFPPSLLIRGINAVVATFEGFTCLLREGLDARVSSALFLVSLCALGLIKGRVAGRRGNETTGKSGGNSSLPREMASLFLGDPRARSQGRDVIVMRERARRAREREAPFIKI